MNNIEGFPNSDGKVVVFTVSEANYPTRGILSPKLEQQAGRAFVVGIVPKYDGGYGEGKPCAVAWDTVNDYIVFDSEEEYLTQLKGTNYDDSIGSFFNMFKKS